MQRWFERGYLLSIYLRGDLPKAASVFETSGLDVILENSVFLLIKILGKVKMFSNFVLMKLTLFQRLRKLKNSSVAGADTDGMENFRWRKMTYKAVPYETKQCRTKVTRFFVGDEKFCPTNNFVRHCFVR